jgi:hypothetical protein
MDFEGEDPVEFGNTCAFLDMLYGDCKESDGALVFIKAERNGIDGIFAVGSGSDLVEAAKHVTGKRGMYFKVNLMDFEKMQARSNGFRKNIVGSSKDVKSIISMHLDVDAGKDGKYLTREHALWAIKQMPLAPTLIINSKGEDGGFHVYWKLKKPVRITSEDHRKEITEISKGWNQKLKVLCKGYLDNTSNIDRILRVGGGKRTSGESITGEFYDWENLYTLEDFRA